MTVGCVIRTVPRRKRVSHAVIADTAKATLEIASEMLFVLFTLILSGNAR